MLVRLGPSKRIEFLLRSTDILHCPEKLANCMQFVKLVIVVVDRHLVAVLVYQCCGAGAEAEEPKLNCLLEPKPKLRIAAPAPFYLLQT
jgi:hypothetical protein